VIHRDVKPGNLLLDDGGNLWVTDFGLAYCQGQPGLTMTGDLVGTLRYMSPEQALAKSMAVDHRTDIYSLGATLYELLTLRPPFDCNDREELLRQIAFEEPLPLRRLNKAIPAELETIVLKALEKNPSDRYATAQELAGDLERHLKDEPIRARRPGVRVRLAKWTRRHKPLVANLATAGALLVAALVGLALWYAARASRLADERVRTNEQINAALTEATALVSQAQAGGRDQYVIWAKAREMAGRAQTLAESSLAEPSLVERVQALRARLDEEERDRHMLGRLEEARLPQLSLKDDQYDFAWSNDKYASAFREYGIDVEGLTVCEASARLGQRAIKLDLVAALDDWAAHASENSGRQRLIAIARAVDRDPWRDEVRAALMQKDVPALTALSTTANVDTLPAPTLLLLADTLASLGEYEAGAALLRRARPTHAGDFWINHQLGLFLTLKQPPALAEAIPFFTAASALRPENAIAHHNLGKVLGQTGQWEAAVGAYRQALRLNPHNARIHNNLAVALSGQGKGDEAIAQYRQALRLKSDFALAHFNLGTVLELKGDLAAAIAEFRDALKVNKDHAAAHYNLANALRHQGDPDGAIVEYREAIRCKPGDANAYNNLGTALAEKGDLEGAIAAYRKAIKIKPDLPNAHNNLGSALLQSGNPAAAVGAYRRALQLKKDYANAHTNLGMALAQLGRLDEAIAEHRQALQFDKHNAETYLRLGDALKLRHDFRPALEAYQRGRQLSSGSPALRALHQHLAEQVRDCARLIELGDKLAGILENKTKPASAAEGIALAELCALKRLHGDAVRFYEEAFAAQPALVPTHRYNAACSAALAGCGRAKDAALHEQERERWRGKALRWLRDELAQHSKQRGGSPPELEQTLRHWQRDRDLVGVRDPDALAKLPAAEQTAWRELWADVAKLLAPP
jgi:tetratricopeptide (TPR) repeat protein